MSLDDELSLLDIMLSEDEQAPQEETHNNDSIVTPPDDKNVASDANETVQEGDSESTEDNAADSDEPPEELAPLEDRLAEFEAVIPEVATEETDVSTPRGLIAKLEAESHILKQEIQSSPLNNLPQGGIYQKDGKWVFHMTEPEINDYLTELKDNGQEFSAAQVQTAIVNALHEVPRLQAKHQALAQRASLIFENQQIAEWQDFKTEVSRKLPEITQEDFNRIGNYVDSQASTDPRFAESIRTKEGKVLKGVEAARKLGILQRLKASANPNASKTPSAPDSRVVGKRVQATATGTKTYKRSEVEAMSQAEFNRLPEAVVDAMLRGDNVIED